MTNITRKIFSSAGKYTHNIGLLSTMWIQKYFQFESLGKYECERDFCLGLKENLSSSMVERLTRIQEICSSNPGWGKKNFSLNIFNQLTSTILCLPPGLLGIRRVASNPPGWRRISMTGWARRTVYIILGLIFSHKTKKGFFLSFRALVMYMIP